jgi:hypothetical protein
MFEGKAFLNVRGFCIKMKDFKVGSGSVIGRTLRGDYDNLVVSEMVCQNNKDRTIMVGLLNSMDQRRSVVCDPNTKFWIVNEKRFMNFYEIITMRKHTGREVLLLDETGHINKISHAKVFTTSEPEVMYQPIFEEKNNGYFVNGILCS